jgi:hypothetical protein
MANIQKKYIFRIIRMVAFLSLITSCIHVKAQLPTATERSDSSHVYYFYNNIQTLNRIKSSLRDTLPNNIHLYDPVYKQQSLYATLGNIGLPVRNLVPEFKNSAGFNYGRNSFDIYKFDIENIPYYLSRTPFSEITYVMGPDKENLLQAHLNRPLYKGLTLGLQYRLISSNGAYSNQDVTNNNFTANLRFFSKNRRYGMLAGFISNSLSTGFNGGIQDDAIFENNIEQNRKVITVNLSTASGYQKGIKLFLSHFYEAGIQEASLPDTTQSRVEGVALVDSLKLEPVAKNTDTLITRQNPRKLLRFGRFSHSLTYSRDAYLFEDTKPDKTYYPVFYIDSTLTHDSVFIGKIENEFSWTNSSYLLESKFPLKIRVAAKHQFVEFKSDSMSRKFNQIIPSAAVQLFLYDRFLVSGDAFFVKGDYNDGDFGIAGKISTVFKQPDWIVGVRAGLSSEKPDYYFQYHYGNSYRWDNAFSRQEVLRAGIFLNIPKTELSADYLLINELVYFNKDALPAQNDGQISLLRARLQNKITYRRLSVENLVVLQYTNDSSILNLPLLNLRSSIYLTQVLFNQALLFEPGLTVSFNTPYYSDAFSPATNMFYLQEEKKTGGFVVIDLFANFKVNRARLFLRYRHVNGSFSGFDYYAVPHYPLQDAGLNFGVIWPFYD